MRVEGGRIIIDNAFLVDFCIRKGTNELFVSCEQLLTTMFTICDKNPENASNDFIKTQFDIMRNELVESLQETQAPDFTDVIDCIQMTQEQVMEKIDKFSHIRNTNRFKGEEGELIVYDILKRSFTPHDGYTVTRTNSVAHNCDMVVQRIGFPDIRVECKAYGKESGVDVKESMVKKFLSDLIKTETHGVMVSVHSGISSKNDIDFEIVPTTNKFAFYVSGNYCQVVPEIIRLVYKFDKLYNPDDQDSNVTVLSNHTVTLIRDHISDFGRKLSEIKSHLDTSVRLLGQVYLDKIESLIVALPPECDTTCYICGFVAKSKGGLTQHMIKCKKSVTLDISAEPTGSEKLG
jgi:hypothetical protein